MHQSHRTEEVVRAVRRGETEVVDFLFSHLALLVATAVHLVGEDAMVGCIAGLYASMEKLDPNYVQLGVAKHALLCPTMVSPAANSSVLHLMSPAWESTES